MLLLGYDIGGTKSAVITALYENEKIEILDKKVIATKGTPYEVIDTLNALATEILGGNKPDRIGISCGGPLDSKKGIIMSPPNLPTWDNFPICDIIEGYFGIRPALQNDANAGAVAEWKFGAGKGFNNVIFMTFGTGLGAGLILDGRLYDGTNGNAGEVGHIRLMDDGPVGFGKNGSFEGFCSGNGLAQLGVMFAEKAKENGITPLYCKADEITAKTIAEAANMGDETAVAVYSHCGKMLGKGLSIVIDILNPERIIIGSVFTRSEALLRTAMQQEIQKEALSISADVCKVVPAMLSENIGDYAAIGVSLL